MVEWLMLLLILGAIVVVILMTTIVQIEQYEAGVALRLGKYHSMLNPGWNFVVPLITQVFKVDLRIQVLDVHVKKLLQKITHQRWLTQLYTTKLQMLRKQYWQ